MMFIVVLIIIFAVRSNAKDSLTGQNDAIFYRQLESSSFHIEPYKYRHIMNQEFHFGKLSVIGYACVRFGYGQTRLAHGKDAFKTHVIRDRTKSFPDNVFHNLTLIPELAYGCSEQPHMYHSWQSFWPALYYYILHPNDVSVMLLPNHFMDATFMRPVISGIKKLYPFIHIDTKHTYQFICNVENALVFGEQADPTGNGNLGLTPISMNLNKLAKDIWKVGCDLPSEPTHTDDDVLFLLRDHRSAGHHRYIKNIDDVYQTFQQNNIKYSSWVFHHDSTFCEQLNATYRSYKVGIAMHGQEILAFAMLPPQSVVIEVSPPCRMGYTFCDPMASSNISIVQFTRNNITFEPFDYCNSEKDAMHKFCDSVQYPEGMTLEESEERPILSQEDIHLLVNLVKSVIP